MVNTYHENESTHPFMMLQQVVLHWIVLMLFASSLQAQHIDQLLARADSLKNNLQEKDALALYERILEASPDDIRALTNASLLNSRQGNRMDKQAEKRAHFERALYLAEKAITSHPDVAESHYVKAIALGRMALIAGVKERVELASPIKYSCEAALQRDSTHAGAHYILGRWHLRVASMGFLERSAALIVAGGVEASSSIDEALEHLSKAVTLNPEFIVFRRDYAEALLAKGRKTEAIAQFRYILSLSNQTEDDERYKTHARNRLKELIK